MTNYKVTTNNSKLSYFFPLIIGLSIAAGIWIGLVMSSKNNTTYIINDNSFSSPSSRVNEILRLIEARYLEDEDINALEEEAINSVLKNLDPHSTFISIKDIEASSMSFTILSILAMI